MFATTAVESFDSEVAQALRICTVGTLPPGFREAISHNALHVPFADGRDPIDALILLPGEDADIVLAQMHRSGNSLAAFIDLSGGKHPRADFAAPAPTREALQSGIDKAIERHNARMRIAAIPHNGDEVGLSMLALAHTRETDLRARLDPGLPGMVVYPLLSGITEPRAQLEALAGAKLLQRHFFERLYICRHCNSSRMLARDVCLSCGSTNLEEETLVHHYRCGELAPRSAFLAGDELICPKCNRTLRHFGVDYDMPGSVQKCNACGRTASEPEAGFLCADCQGTTRGIDAQSIDWFHYSLTATGHAAVVEGRLPGIGLEAFLNGLPGWRTPRDFALMLDLTHRLSGRYERPYSVLQMDCVASMEATAELGRVGVAKIHNMMVELVRQTVRETDFFAAIDNKIILLLPETSAEKCETLIARLRERSDEALGDYAQLVARINEERIPVLIEQLSK